LTSLGIRSFAASDSNIFAGTYDGVFVSSDNGANWRIVNSGLMNATAWSLAVKGTYLFAGNYEGVFVSRKIDASWTVIDSGLTNIPVQSLAVSGTNLFAGTNNGVFLSKNNGVSWNAVNSGMTNPYSGTNPSIWSLAVNGANLYAGTSLGVFLSTDNGTSWNAINSGLPITDIYALVVSGNDLFAGNSYGVWRRPLSATPTYVEKISSTIPLTSVLNQNYPNPFNPSTAITFSLRAKSFVSLKIYDLIGREVAIIVSEELAAGVYTRKWNASNIPSGIYFYRLQAGSFTETRKLVLLK
jgi:ligand-binding sensor domain-containing protein